MATAAYTSSYSAARDADQRDDGRSHPTLTTRPMPAERAAASTPSTGRPRMSMCVWLSRPPGAGSASAPEPGEPELGTPGPFGLLIAFKPGDFLINHGPVSYTHLTLPTIY